MKKVLTYDLVTRLFHISFGVLFVISFSIGKFVDDDSVLHSYHMISGIMMSVIVVFRILWGVFGTKYAQFKSFKLKPRELKNYFKDILNGTTKRELGHNPASSYAAVAMFTLTLLLAISGLLMVNGVGGEFFEESHELLAGIFLVIVFFHIGGIVFHQFSHNDGIALSIFTGKKDPVEGEVPIQKNAILASVYFLILLFGSGTYLLGNFDQTNRNLHIGNFDFQLKEKEHGDEAHYEKDHSHRHGERHEEEDD